MSKVETQYNFSGPYKGLLGELSELIDWLNADHDVSFVKAGDNALFAYGGDGFVVIFNETIWGGLVELLTPGCTFAIKPGEDDKIIGVLTGTGGIAEHLREIVGFASKQTTARLVYASEPERLIDECLSAWHSRKAQE